MASCSEINLVEALGSGLSKSARLRIDPHRQQPLEPRFPRRINDLSVQKLNHLLPSNWKAGSVKLAAASSPP
jgi:hypothetical protein